MERSIIFKFSTSLFVFIWMKMFTKANFASKAVCVICVYMVEASRGFHIFIASIL